MESTSFRDFLEIREKEIRDLRSQLLVELREIKTAKMAIQNNDSTEDSEPVKPKKTIKDMVQDVLKEHGDGGSADQIIEWIAKSFKTDIARSSLSPQLSRLKSEGVLTTGPADGFWRLRRMVPRGNSAFGGEENISSPDARIKVRRRPVGGYRQNIEDFE